MNRSVILGAGLLLLAAGAGALLSSQPGLIGPAVGGGIVLVLVAGVLSLQPVRRSFQSLQSPADRDDKLRTLLSDALTKGNALQAELRPLTDDPGVLEPIQERAEMWATHVRNVLDDRRPGWSAHFLDDTYRPQFSSQHGNRDRTINWLERRTSKLGELLARLG